MRLILFLLILLQFGFTQSSIQVTLENVKGKTDYFFSESIYLKLRIENKTQKLLTFKSEHLSKLFIIEKENDYFLEPYLQFSYETHCRIFPADSFVTYWNITTAFNERDKIEGLEYGLSAGNYIIYFLYNNDSLYLESNQLRFRVISPPDFEKKAFELYNQAMEMFWNNKKKKRSQLEKSLAFLKVVDTYPQSVYAPSALYLAQITGENREKLGLRLIDEYPFAPEIWNLLISNENRYRVNRDKSGVANFLQELITKHPNSFAAKEAQRRLVEIQPLTLEEWLNPELKRERRLKEYRQLHPEK